MNDQRHTVCTGCKNEIDPETCWCGDSINGHSYAPGHGFVPMGCDCMRNRAEEGLANATQQINDGPACGRCGATTESQCVCLAPCGTE